MYFYKLSISLLCLCCCNAWAIVDNNDNGMSDIWEQRYGAEAAVPSLDYDEDGMTCLEESLAGTNPFLASSTLKIVDNQYHPSSVILSWQSSKGVSYQVEQTSDLGGLWTNVGSVMYGNGAEIDAVFDPVGGQRVFYRVKIAESERFKDLPIGADSLIGHHDADGDGLSDLQEMRYGIDPFDASSVLPRPQIAFGPGAVIQWNSELGKRYLVQSKLAAGGTWNDEGGFHPGNGGQITAAVHFGDAEPRDLRVTVQDVDTDDDGLSDWEEYQVGLNPNMAKTDTLGDGDLVVANSLLAAPNEISVRASKAVANISRMEDGSFELTRKGGVSEVVVSYSVSGTALAGGDYVALSGSVSIPFGKHSAIIAVNPLAGSSMGLSESVILTLQNSQNYDLGLQISQQVNVLKEVAIDVKAFGAVGDGITDDTASIQAAIDALEASTVQNTLYFPSGKYRLNTRTSDTITFGNNHLLLMDSDLLSGRDLIIRGDTGAILYSTVSPYRASILPVYGKFRSLVFRGMTWEKDSVPLYAISKEPNGADGVTILRHDERTVEALEFHDCTFINCHGAVFVHGSGYDVNGKLRRVQFENCQILNPYGANTVNSAGSFGGGQTVFLSPWVGLAIYENNLFDGGGDDMTDSATCPGGRMKDASHFGSPLELIFRSNIVRRMGAEALFQVHDKPKMSSTQSDFFMPPADGVSTVTVKVGPEKSTFWIGQTVNLHVIGALPGENTHNIMEVTGFDPSLRNITLKNTGHVLNADSGAFMARFMTIFNDGFADPSLAEISNNVFEGTLPLGAMTIGHYSGIAINARSKISDNIVSGFAIGLMLYDEAHTPVYPASRGSVIRGNYIILPDTRDNPDRRLYGINSYVDDIVISENFIKGDGITNWTGIALRMDDSIVTKNTVHAHDAIFKSYYHPYRTLGIAVGANATGSMLYENTTINFDVGLGPDVYNQFSPYYVKDHVTIGDILGVDPAGVVWQ